jgi:hypothetical protein
MTVIRKPGVEVRDWKLDEKAQPWPHQAHQNSILGALLPQKSHPCRLELVL